ncbi:hypothetical protein D3C85_1270220 [compost metagenome]
MGLGGDPGHQIGGQVGVDLDARGGGAARHGDGQRQVGVGGHGLHPRRPARDRSGADGLGARVPEEAFARHQGGVIDVGRGHFADAGLTRQLADRAQVVGHAAHGGDAGIEPAPHLHPRGVGVGRGGDMDMGVDQAGQDVEARDIDRLGGWGQGGAVGLDGQNAFALGDEGQAGA